MKRLSLCVSFSLIAISLAFASDPVQLNPLNVEKAFQYPFKGQWLPAANSLYVGAENYTTLQNMRYTDAGLETVEGYSKITTNALGTGSYTILSGFHFNKDDESHVLTKVNNSGTYQIYDNETAIPSTGDYTATPLNTTGFETVALGSGLGSFSNAPKGLLLYGDSTGVYIYGGSGVDPVVVFRSTDSSIPLTDYFDYTEEATNTTDDFNFVNGQYLYIGSPYRIRSFTFTISSANASASTIAFEFWDGSTWTSETVTDGTSASSKTLAQSGTIVTDQTDIPQPYYVNQNVLYWYRFSIGTGTCDADISQITLTLPLQPVIDVWNQSLRTCISFHANRSGEYEDYTYQVSERSTKDAPYSATVGDIHGSDALYLMFEEPIIGLDIKMLEGLTNQISTEISSLSFWDGDSYVAVAGLVDRTEASAADTTLNKSGVISWAQRSTDFPKPKEEFGVLGYSYKIVFNGALTDAATSVTSSAISFTNATSTIAITGAYNFEDFESGDTIHISGSTNNDGIQTIVTVSSASIVVSGTLTDESAGAGVTIYSYEQTDHDGTSIDTVGGITAPLSMGGYQNVGFYGGRAMLINGNKVDYSLPNYPWIYNGVNTSNEGNPNPAPLYFGDNTDITATRSLSNRYGSNIIESWVVTKNNATFTLTGAQPYLDFNEPFIIRKMSSTVGCPAPMTMKEVQITQENIQRNGLMWMSSTGPVIFDGAVIEPVKGIENYFDPTKTEYIKTSLIEDATAYYDAVHYEYNLCFPSGSSASDNNVWLVYDLKHRKWYEKVVSSLESIPYPPTCAFEVTDTDGIKYNYGNSSYGHLYRLDNTQKWDTHDIAQKITTGSFIPQVTGEYGLWDFSEIIKAKLISNAISEDADASMAIYGDGTKLKTDAAIALDASVDISVNDSPSYFRLKNTTYKFEFEATTGTNKWNPLFWGYRARYLREK